MAATKKANGAANDFGYRTFALGGFEFERDEYFAHIAWPGGTHSMPVDLFLRAMIRDLAWSFFYGTSISTACSAPLITTAASTSSPACTTAAIANRTASTSRISRATT